MLTPRVSDALKQVISLYQRSLFGQDEFGRRLASLVTPENLTDMLDALPGELIPLFKDGMVATVQDAIDEDHLYPEESPFRENPVPAFYYSRVTEVLLQPISPRAKAILTVVCLPSFQVEWALRLFRSYKVPDTLVLTEPREKIWCQRNPNKIEVRVKERTIDRELGTNLCNIWEKLLRATRQPKRARVGLDGVSFHFDYRGLGAGRTWSPHSSTVPGKLVALSDALRALVETDDNGIDHARTEVENRIVNLKVNG